MNFKLSDIARLRLSSQQLYQTSFKTGKQLVEWFAAVQGQEYAQTKWGLGLRLAHLTDNDIEKELTEGKILRTHLLRPTWHFVSADDIRWLLGLTAPNVNKVSAYMHRQSGLDAPLFKRCNKIIGNCLEGNKHLTRDEIKQELKRKKILADGVKLSYIMMHCELDGIICSGIKRGNQFTYALLEERAPTTQKLIKEEALAELTKRYFISRGPATINDYSTWSGLTIADCKRGLEVVMAELDNLLLNSKTYYFSNKLSPVSVKKKDIYLLPTYDEYIMGYKDRSAMLNTKNGLATNPPLQFDSMILFDGQIIGTWKRVIGKIGIEVEVDFFQTLSQSQNKLFKKAIGRLEEFSGMKVSYIEN